MKRRILILSCFVVLGVFLVFCNKNMGSSTGNKKASEEVYNRLESKGFKRVDVLGKELKSSNNLNSGNFNMATACMAYEPTMKNYIKHADAIIKGEVTGIEYFDCNGLPWSRASVSVQDIIFGNVEDEICIYLMEGFLYNGMDSLSAFSSDNIGLHNIGDISVFVLSMENGENTFEKGSYQRTYGTYSEYRYIKDKEEYFIDDTRIDGNLNETELISRIKHFIDKSNKK